MNGVHRITKKAWFFPLSLTKGSVALSEEYVKKGVKCEKFQMFLNACNIYIEREHKGLYICIMLIYYGNIKWY